MISETLFNSILNDNKRQIKQATSNLKKKYFAKEPEVKQAMYIAIWKYADKYSDNHKTSFINYIARSASWILIRDREANVFKVGDKKIGDETSLNNSVKCVNINTSDLNDCLETLPIWNREVLKKYYLEGKNLREISAEMGKSLETIRKYQLQGLEIFRKKWKNE